MLPADRRRWSQPRQRNAIFVLASIFFASSCIVPLTFSLLRSSTGFLCGRPSESRQQGKVAAAAEAQAIKRTKLKKGEKYDARATKYRGPVSPQLRKFVGAAEYREMLQLLNKLESQGMLEKFLGKAEDYWERMDFMQMAALEQKGGGQAIIKQIRKDWTRIWPTELGDDRSEAFEQFSRFLLRLDRSKVLDLVMNEVLPEIQSGYDGGKAQKASERLRELSPAERREEFTDRLLNSQIVAQYVGLSKGDKDLAAIGPQMTRFTAKCISILEYKVSMGIEAATAATDFFSDGKNQVLVVVLVLMVIGGFILFKGAEVPTNPLEGPLPKLGYSAPAPDPVYERDPSKIPKYIAPTPANKVIMDLAD
mmetsp:Transcript_20291/g.36219  ORF Transcript_20291/g.36219 Transcript_20291/m.36219 type:complete len:365 (+) Transcript_20291:51-1145(+)